MLAVWAFAIGVACGLRSMSGPAAIAWAANYRWLILSGTPLAFFGISAVRWILTFCAVGEWIADKLPFIPSRKAPGPFFFRLLGGSACGGAICFGTGPATGAKIAVFAGVGLLGALCGTLGGYEFRRRLVLAIGGNDWPIALLEDAIAVALVSVSLWQLSRNAAVEAYFYDVL